jgi:hypothetical protein
MQKIMLMIIIIIPTYLFSQEMADPLEISTQTENFNDYDQIYYTIEPHSQYSTAWYISKTTSKWVIDPNPESSEEYILGNNTGTDRGFQVHPWADSWEPFWHALNKITIFVDPVGTDPKTEWFYFYIDHRDCNFRVLDTDHTLRYDKNNTDKIFLVPDLPKDDDFWNDTVSVSEGGVVNIWNLLDYGSNTISCFLPTPTDINVEEYNNKPKITWSHGGHPNGSFSYEVYRLLTTLPHPKFGTWYLINTVTDTFYVDNEICIGEGDAGNAFYKIKAKIDDLESPYSDYDYIPYGGINKPVVKNTDVMEITEFKLNTNYPNPFNPSTKISFDIREKTPVELTVYDIQGKKVVTLVNETLEKGNYSIEFNAGNLPSGAYFYRLQTDEFTDIKRMLLLK